VLTEDDYLDFLVNISRDEDLIPPRVQEAMAGTSLLFLGYRLADWNFRVLFRSLVSYLERTIARAHVSVQLVPLRDTAPDLQRQKAQEYLQRYFGKLEIRVYWGSCQDFATELRNKWEAHNVS
jgi:SIR2-like domain